MHATVIPPRNKPTVPQIFPQPEDKKTPILSTSAISSTFFAPSSEGMSTDTPLPDPLDITEPLSALSRPDLKRTLRDLLVQDEVSDSDVEMLEKHASTPLLDDEPLDPDMCVECGDQVLPPPRPERRRTVLMGR